MYIYFKPVVHELLCVLNYTVLVFKTVIFPQVKGLLHAIRNFIFVYSFSMTGLGKYSLEWRIFLYLYEHKGLQLLIAHCHTKDHQLHHTNCNVGIRIKNKTDVKRGTAIWS